MMSSQVRAASGVTAVTAGTTARPTPVSASTSYGVNASGHGHAHTVAAAAGGAAENGSGGGSGDGSAGGGLKAGRHNPRVSSPIAAAMAVFETGWESTGRHHPGHLHPLW